MARIPQRARRDPRSSHELRSTWTQNAQGIVDTGPACDCGWKPATDDWATEVQTHASDAGIDLEAVQRDSRERISAVYDMLWSRVLGPDYRPAVRHFTIEEAQALTTVGFEGNKSEKGQRAFAIVEAAIARLVPDRPARRREPLTSHPLEVVCPPFAEAVRGDLFGLEPCLRRLAEGERSALLQAIVEHSPARTRPGVVSSLAEKLLTLIWAPDTKSQLFSLSSEIRSQYAHTIGLWTTQSKQEKAEAKRENQRLMKNAKQEQQRREASGEAQREREQEAALIGKLDACVRRRDIGTAKRLLRPLDSSDRWILMMTLRLQFSETSAATFDAAVCEAAAWAFETPKPDPGIVDLILGAFLTALPDRREGER